MESSSSSSPFYPREVIRNSRAERLDTFARGHKTLGESVLPGFRDKTGARQTLIIGHKWAQSDVCDKQYRTEPYIYLNFQHRTEENGVRQFCLIFEEIFLRYPTSAEFDHETSAVTTEQPEQDSQNQDSQARAVRTG
jgi:hypothetical protein